MTISLSVISWRDASVSSLSLYHYCRRWRRNTITMADMVFSDMSTIWPTWRWLLDVTLILPLFIDRYYQACRAACVCYAALRLLWWFASSYQRHQWWWRQYRRHWYRERYRLHFAIVSCHIIMYWYWLLSSWHYVMSLLCWFSILFFVFRICSLLLKRWQPLLSIIILMSVSYWALFISFDIDAAIIFMTILDAIVGYHLHGDKIVYSLFISSQLFLKACSRWCRFLHASFIGFVYYLREQARPSIDVRSSRIRLSAMVVAWRSICRFCLHITAMATFPRRQLYMRLARVISLPFSLFVAVTPSTCGEAIRPGDVAAYFSYIPWATWYWPCRQAKWRRTAARRRRK